MNLNKTVANTTDNTTISDFENIGVNVLENLQEFRWIIIFYFILLTCGSLLNLIHFLALIRSRRNGTLSLVLQISVVDIASFYVAVSEILTLNQQNWFFSAELCPLFKGTEVLINSLTVYLLICFNFHVISLWNLHDTEIKKNNKNPLTSCSSSSSSNEDDSNECLVTRQENSNRFVTIDYRKRKDDISIVFPTIFIWIVSLSLSVPNFTLSSTLRLKENYTLCAVIDVYYGQILQHSLLTFKIVLPAALLLLSLIILIFKLSETSKSDIDNILTKKLDEVRKLVIFAIAITSVYLVTSFQRQFLHFFHVITYSFNENNVNNFKMPPLFNNYLNRTSITYLAMLHYLGGTLRALLCLVILPKFRYLIRSKVFICCPSKK